MALNEVFTNFAFYGLENYGIISILERVDMELAFW